MIRIKAIARHRNGVSGEPFYVVKFSRQGCDALELSFDAPHHVAVFNLRLLLKGDIAFGSNSFRAEHYEKPLTGGHRAMGGEEAASESARWFMSIEQIIRKTSSDELSYVRRNR